MKFPKIKNALLCRILVFVVVIGAFLLPIAIIIPLGFIPPEVKLIVGCALALALVFYIVKNFVVLMGMDVELAVLHAKGKARKSFTLPERFTPESVEARLPRYGMECIPEKSDLTPHSLRYKSKASLTVYSKGKEGMIASYYTPHLSAESYRDITESAKLYFDSLKGRKKQILLDKAQKKAPLNIAAVILIFATRVEDSFKSELFEAVADKGDGFDLSILPCVIDLMSGVATFDSLLIPNVGAGNPAKNRAIQLIEKYLFDGRLTYEQSPDTLEPEEGYDPEESLWSFWRRKAAEAKKEDIEMVERYQSMAHGEIILEDGYIYLKWGECGIWVSAEEDTETGEVEIDAIDYWYYPKSSKIDPESESEIKKLLISYYADLGFKAKFISYDE